ncbi:unnamed protein product [Rotaria sp. Silwood1]|nr:unnamed protein product [Rotaria sp. Silwood1]
MDDDIAAVKLRVREIIDSASSDKTMLPCEIIVVAFEIQTFFIVSKPETEGDLERLLNFLDSLTTFGGTEFVMNAIVKGLSLSNDQCLVYIFMDESGDDRERGNEVTTLAKRKNCKINFLLSGDVNRRLMASQETKAEGKAYLTFEQIALETGGIKVDVTKDNIFNITQIISQTINTLPVPILLVNSVVSGSNLYNFNIDSSVETIRFLINIKPAFWFLTNDDVKSLFTSPDHSSTDFLLTFGSIDVKIGQINKPTVGLWQFEANSSFVSSFEITLVTSIQFEHSFNNLNNESAHPGLQSIDTDPIKGYKLYSLIRVVQTTIGRIVLDELEFVDSIAAFAACL